MKPKFYAILDNWNRPVTVIEAKNIEQARKRVKRISKNDLIKINGMKEIIIGE